MLTQASEPSKNYSLSLNESKHRNEPPAKSRVKQLHMASSQRDNFPTLKKKNVVYNFSAAAVKLFPLVFFKVPFKKRFALVLHLLVMTFRQDVELVHLTLTSAWLSMRHHVVQRCAFKKVFQQGHTALCIPASPRWTFIILVAGSERRNEDRVFY